MTLSHSISELIKAWLGRSRINNLNLLSQRAQVPYSTVYRLAKKSSEKPPLDGVVGVLSVVASEHERAEIFRTYYPSVYVATQERRSREPQLQGPLQTTEPVLDSMMASPIGFMLAQQILSKAGVTSARVQKLYGDHGLGYLEVLQDSQLVEQGADGSWRAPVEYANPTLAGNKAQVTAAVDAWSLASHATGRALLETRSESVSLEGALRIKQVLQSALQAVRAIHDECPGNHTYVLNLVLQLADPQLALEEMGEPK